MWPIAARLRSVLFHHVADVGSSFTDGLGVRMGVDDFRSRIVHLSSRYEPVSLDQVRDATDGAPLPGGAVLITFDDAYASVAENAAAILEEHAVPAVFFVNSNFVDHGQLGTDNLVAHVANTAGPRSIARAVATLDRTAADRSIKSMSMGDVLSTLIPTLRLPELAKFRRSLIVELGYDPLEIATSEGLYVSRKQLSNLSASIAIGSHTASHVRCRTLGPDDMAPEIHANRQVLQQLTSQTVSAFSVPYGSSDDFLLPVQEAVAAAGHDLAFLVEGRLNHGPLGAGPIRRVSLSATSNTGSAIEIELLPRLRYVRDKFRRRRTE